MADLQQKPELPGFIEGADDGDRPSVTEVDGTVARFEMAYNPNPSERFAFGPPLWQRLPSLLFLGFAATLATAAMLAHQGSSNTVLYRFIVAENRTPLVFVIVLAAIATFIRSGLRGVIITREGVEMRTLSMGFPLVQSIAGRRLTASSWTGATSSSSSGMAPMSAYPKCAMVRRWQICSSASP